MTTRAGAGVAGEQPMLPGFEQAAEDTTPSSPATAMPASPQLPTARAPLTDEQRPAVERRSEPLLLAAAAGSGKTSVLVERFVRAVCEDGVGPERILAITFTDRAAAELRARIRERLLDVGERVAAQSAESAFITTFHGFCARLLRAHPLAGAVDPSFAVLDEGLASRLRERAFATALAGLLAEREAPVVDLVAAYGPEVLRAMVVGAYLELRSSGQIEPRLPGREEPGGEPAGALAALRTIDRLLQEFSGAYEQLKRSARGALDFDDLELRAVQMLERHDRIRRSWTERLELLMVDEFQDTNARQLRLLAALERDNLFTVGDELQSIYGFRHADVRLFRERRRELASRGGTLALTRNFRSRPALLEVVNAVFADRFAEQGPSPLIAGREEREAGPRARGAGGGREPLSELLLTAAHGWDEDEELARRLGAGLPASQAWRQAEARALAQRVAELVSQGAVRAGDVVVLLRSTPDLEIYERALQLCGLPTLATVGTFWAQQQIGDLVAYLRALANPLDEEALFSVLASPLAGCTRDGLLALAQARRQSGGGLWGALLALLSADVPPSLPLALSDQDRAAARDIARLLVEERAVAPNHSPASLIERGLAATGYRERVLGLDWGERRAANLDKLLRVARSFEEREGRDLRGFLDHVAHLARMALQEPQAPVDAAGQDAVRLMTIHAAKGLEFPVVCVADLGRKPRVKTPELLLDGPRVGLRLSTLDGEEPEKTLDYEQLAEERTRREAEEEDRILYVAMTRARERLLLSGAVGFERSWPSSDGPGSPPISWVVPALCAGLPERLMAGERAIEQLQVGATAVRFSLLTPAAARAGHLALPSGEGRQLVVPVASAGGGGDAGVVPRPPSRSAPSPPGAGAGPEPAVVVPAAHSFSYSSLAELERCGYRFYLERGLGLPEDRAAAREGEGLSARERGIVVHALLERVDYRDRLVPPNEEIVAVAGALGIELAPAAAEEISALVGGALDAPLSERVAALHEVRREHPFAFALAEQVPLIVGVIDLLGSERVSSEDRPVVVDYKSDRVGPEMDLEQLVAGSYSLQRALYALAVLRGGARTVEVVHWFLQRPAQPVSAVFTADQMPQLERELRGLLDYRPVPSPHPHRGLCLTCPGRRGLCSWGEAETMRELPGAPGLAVS